MKLLAPESNYAGHFLRQIWRSGDVAVFARSRAKNGPAHELEMIIVEVNPEWVTPTGLVVPESEVYPSPSKWGKFGWSFPARYIDWVLALAEKLAKISHARGSLVRSAITDFKTHA